MLVQAVALAADFHEMRVMHQPIEEGSNGAERVGIYTPTTGHQKHYDLNFSLPVGLHHAGR
jgi:hypothetical protein